MEHPTGLDLERLSEYLTGEASSETRAILERWAANDPARARDLAELRHVWTLAHTRPHRDIRLTEEARQALLDRIERDVSCGEPSVPVSPARLRSNNTRTWNTRLARYGSVVGLCVVAVFGAWAAWFSRVGTPAETQVYRTAPGQRSTVRLSDGSTMMLGPSTTVTTTNHEVNVTGEVYVTVAPNPARPFTVRTSNALVQVLGTRFAVRQYPGEHRSRVVVEEGRVALSSARATPSRVPSAVASAHMLAFISDSGVALSSGIATRDYTSWTQGTLVFDGVPLRDVVPELARAYGMDIRIADSALAQRLVRTEVSVSSDPLSVVLDMLCRVLDAHYERQPRDGRAYVISPGRVGAQNSPLSPSRHLSPKPEQQYGR